MKDRIFEIVYQSKTRIGAVNELAADDIITSSQKYELKSKILDLLIEKLGEELKD